MKRIFHLCLIAVLTAVMLACSSGHKKYLIGVSQCSEDSWRTKLKAELDQSTYFNENVELVMLSADDNIEQQRKQIQRLIDDKVDLLIISPQQTGNLTDAITKARKAGIPVILFDRKSGASNYTAFMGADNYLIGKMLGEYAAGQLGGKGNIVEIAGQHGSSPAIDRRNGFDDAVKKYPDLHIIAFEEGDWKLPSGEKAMNTALDKLQKEGQADVHIDCVYGGNDRMAEGARRALEKYAQCHPEGGHGNPASVMYLGVDALPTPGGGIEKVRDGRLTVSAIYPTQGDKVMQLALDILEGKPYDKETMMETSLVTQANANVLLMQHKEVESQNDYIKRMHLRIDSVLWDLGMQRVFMLSIILVLALLASFTVYTVRVNRLRRQLNSELRQKNDELNAEKEIVERQRDELEEERDKLLDATSPEQTEATPTLTPEQMIEQSVSRYYPPTNESASNSFITELMEYLDKHLSESELSVEDIGKALCMSRVNLYRKVKSLTGKTPVELIREERLKRAKVLLKDSALSVSEVAYKVGFSAPSYFTKCYKDFYGKAPSEKE